MFTSDCLNLFIDSEMWDLRMLKLRKSIELLNGCYSSLLDNDIFVDSNMNYIITYNIDLMTNKILTNDDLLSKYNYSKNYIGEKLFIEDILIGNDQVVIDKYTNISLTQKDIERRKDYYVERIIQEFDSIVVMYIDSGSLVLSYDKNKLKEIFFDGDFNTQIQERYLK